jgi:hypothetical protein
MDAYLSFNREIPGSEDVLNRCKYWNSATTFPVTDTFTLTPKPGNRTPHKMGSLTGLQLKKEKNGYYKISTFRRYSPEHENTRAF